jgi:hypothetical protein
MPPALFALVIFDIESSFLPGPAWTVILLFTLPAIAGMTGVHYSSHLLAEMESSELFAWAGFDPPDLSLLMNLPVPTLKTENTF